MKIVWFIKQSIILDYKFIKTSKWAPGKKISFLIKKYFLLFKHFMIPFTLGKDAGHFMDEDIYYGSRFGFADYQAILARHQKLMAISHLKIKKNGVIIDVGAHVGFFSKLVRDIYPQSSIHSIEPIPIIFSCLSKNFQNDQKTYLYNIAISDKTKKVMMKYFPDRTETSKITKNGNVTIQAKSLDDFIKEQKIKQIDLLKIDTEGFEELVLSGAYKALSITKYLFIEVTLKDNPNYTLSSLMSHLYSKDFNFNLLAFRNFGDTSEGKIPLVDCLLKNIKKVYD